MNLVFGTISIYCSSTTGARSQNSISLLSHQRIIPLQRQILSLQYLITGLSLFLAYAVQSFSKFSSLIYGLRHVSLLDLVSISDAIVCQ
ncbi:hypothetical protein CPC08DRAFT_119741 [Agrocybe pediades]|nr:hypothetical protein CPC08DRAFT_119741 [Agrocybe pediades]